MLQDILSSIAAIVLMIPPIHVPDVARVGEALESAEAPEKINPASLPKQTTGKSSEPSIPPPAPKPVQVKPRPSWAIPWRIVKCESGGNYRAQNPRSTASGAYQMIQSTANRAAKAIGHPELVGRRASSWPPHLQDQAAAWLWDGGRGKSHWKSCL